MGLTCILPIFVCQRSLASFGLLHFILLPVDHRLPLSLGALFDPALGIPNYVFPASSGFDILVCRSSLMSLTQSFHEHIFKFPEHNMLGEPSSSVRMRIATHKNVLTGNVAWVLSHLVSLSAWLYEIIL